MAITRASKKARLEAASASEATAEEIDLHSIAELVFLHLTPSIEAITVPVLSKWWHEWAEEEEAVERALG